MSSQKTLKMANTEYDQFECDVEFSFYLLKTEEGAGNHL